VHRPQAAAALLALARTALGIVIGRWGLGVLLASLPPGIPRAAEIALDWRLLGIAGLAAVVTGILFGLTPAVFSTRVDLSSALKGGRSGTAGSSGLRFRSLLIVGEMTLALVLLMGALLFGASFLKVTSVPLGIDYRNVAIVSVDNRFQRAAGEHFFAANNRFHELVGRIVERVKAVPGVTAVAATSGVAFSGGRSSFSYELPGRPDFTWQRARHTMLTMKLVSPNYHDLLRIPLQRGRLLHETDLREAPGVVDASESAARQIWPGEDPIGQQIDLQKVLTVVGVVADVRMGAPRRHPGPTSTCRWRRGSVPSRAHCSFARRWRRNRCCLPSGLRSRRWILLSAHPTSGRWSRISIACSRPAASTCSSSVYSAFWAF
jgi:putative ABC transport system permease protein